MRQILPAIILLAFPLFFYGQSTFVRTIGQTGYYSGVKTLEDQQNRLILLANRSGGLGYSEIILYRFDLSGNLLQEIPLTSTFNDIATGFRILDDGYIICGYRLTQTNDYQILLLRLDTAGSIIWNKSYGGPDWDFAHDVETTDLPGFMVSGKTYNTPNGKPSGFVMRFNSLGDSLSRDIISYGQSTSGQGMYKTYNNRILLSGYYTDTLDGNCFYAGFDSLGNYSFSYIVDTLGQQACYEISHTGMYNAMSGYFRDPDSVDLNASILLTDSSNRLIMKQIFGGVKEDLLRGIYVHNSDSIYLAGYTKSHSIGGKEAYGLLSTGDGYWLNSFIAGQKQDDFFVAVTGTSDGGLVFTGTTESFGTAQSSIYFIKTLLDFSYDTANQLHITSIDAQRRFAAHVVVYPNPSKGRVQVLLPDEILRVESICVYDIGGKKVLDSGTLFPPFSIETEAIPNGVYLMVIRSQTGSFFAKLVILR